MNNLNLYPFVEKWLEKGQSIWLYSDPHFGDLEAYALRNNLITYSDKDKYSEQELIKLFPNIVEECKNQDELQIKNINSTVGKKGIFICLGDVGNIEYIKRIKAGYKILVMGNHDKGKTNYQRGNYVQCNFNSDTHELEEKYIDNHLFDEVYDGKLQISKNIVLSHEPVKDEFAFNIHGHDHNCKLMKEFIAEGKVSNELYFNYQLYLIKKSSLQNLNVCAEWINYKPVQLNSIIKSGILNTIQDIHRKAIDKQIENSIQNNH